MSNDAKSLALIKLGHSVNSEFIYFECKWARIFELKKDKYYQKNQEGQNSKLHFLLITYFWAYKLLVDGVYFPSLS
jgi:hypothetical protein